MENRVYSHLVISLMSNIVHVTVKTTKTKPFFVEGKAQSVKKLFTLCKSKVHYFICYLLKLVPGHCDCR